MTRWRTMVRWRTMAAACATTRSSSMWRRPMVSNTNCQAGALARLATRGSGTKWTVWGLSSDYMGVYIHLGHSLCIGLNSVTKRSMHEWRNAQSRWCAAQQGHSAMFYDLLAHGTTLSYPRTPLGIWDPHKGTLSSHLGLSCIYPCRG